jgi:flagellar hook assembly protein FlgD
MRYQLPVRSRVTLKIYDVLGQEIITLVDGIQDAGFRSVEWDASRCTSGMYFYRLQANDVVETKKLILMK